MPHYNQNQWVERDINGQIILVSFEDIDLIDRYKWRLKINPTKNPYVGRETTIDKKDVTIHLHKEIATRLFGGFEDKYVDHINGNTLDNRRENLRLVTPAQNSYNRGKNRKSTSGYKGVTWARKNNKWQASLQLAGKSYYLGLFTDVVEAAKAYDKAALKYFGEYARLNFPGATL